MDNRDIYKLLVKFLNANEICEGVEIFAPAKPKRITIDLIQIRCEEKPGGPYRYSYDDIKGIIDLLVEYGYLTEKRNSYGEKVIYFTPLQMIRFKNKFLKG